MSGSKVDMGVDLVRVHGGLTEWVDRRIRQPDETEQVPSPQREVEDFPSQTRPNRSRRRKGKSKTSPASGARRAWYPAVLIGSQ